MLKIRATSPDMVPTRHEILIRGEKIILFLRPWDAKIGKQIRARHIKGFEWVQNPDTNRREKADIVDNDSLFDDMVDHIIAGFEGVGDESGNPWPVTLDNKKALIALTVENGSQSVWVTILELAKDLAFIAAEDAAASEKN